MTCYLPPATIYTHQSPNVIRPKIRLDFSYLATIRGLLKLFELIFTAIAVILYYYTSSFIYKIDDSYLYRIYLDKEVQLVMKIGYLFYRFVPYVLSFSVNILMWSYVFHVVERYNTIPWYRIECIVSATCALLSLVCGSLSAVVCVELNKHDEGDVKFVAAAFLSIGVFILFIYDIILLYQRMKLKIPPQESSE